MGFVSLLGIFVLVVSIAGCATTKKDMSSEQLQMRISDMEKQIDQKSLEILDLKDQVSELNDELKTSGSTPTVSQKTAKTLSPVEKEIIRVAASPQDIQTSLKNAGYYTGAIDGKIGNNTKKAIKAFQEANGLRADGVIGQKTWLKLKTYLN